MSQPTKPALAEEIQDGALVDEGTSSGHSAAYMKARIRALTSILIKEYGEILDVALPPQLNDEDNAQPQAVSEIARKQLTVEAASTAMVRAAEEIMVLTRTMKELWLFGELDTLEADRDEEERKAADKTRQDESAVVRGMQEWINANGHVLSTRTEQRQKPSDEDSDSDTNMAD